MRVFRHRNDNVKIKRSFYFIPSFSHSSLPTGHLDSPPLAFTCVLFGVKTTVFHDEKEGAKALFKKRWMLVHESYKCIMTLTKQNMQSNVTLSGEVRLNMQLFQKDAWVMNRLRSANASAILTNLIQSHYLTGTGKVLPLLCGWWTQHNKWKEIYASIKQNFLLKNVNYVHLAQLNGCLYPYN